MPILLSAALVNIAHFRKLDASGRTAATASNASISSEMDPIRPSRLATVPPGLAARRSYRPRCLFAAVAPAGRPDARGGRAITLSFAQQQVSSDETTVGSFVSLMLAMLMLGAPLKRVAGIDAWLQPGLAAAGSIFSLLDEETETDAGTISMERAQGELRFEQLSFC